MPTWNETHYARTEEFACLLSEVLAVEPTFSAFSAAPVLTAAPAPAKAPAPLPAAPTPPAAPPPAVPVPAAAPASPATGATAASTFKKFPWKK